MTTRTREKHGLHFGEQRMAAMYTKLKIELSSTLHPELSRITRDLNSILDASENTLNSLIGESQKDGMDLEGNLLDDLIEIISITRAQQDLLNKLQLCISKK